MFTRDRTDRDLVTQDPADCSQPVIILPSGAPHTALNRRYDVTKVERY